jgi:hypothetical protein
MPRALLLLLLLLLPALALAADRDLAVEASPGARLTGKRVALVIGQSAYKSAGRLTQAPKDARRMAAALRADGFEVKERYDVGLLGFSRAVADFEGDLAGADVGFFYYAGHAVQVSDQNYLLPVDADIEAERYVAASTVNVMSVLQAMDRAESRLNLVVLDACRNNPFASKWFASGGRSVSGRGLAYMAAPSGFMLAFATGPGDVAADDGTYAEALAKGVTTSGLEIAEVFGYVHETVKERSGARQIPWVQEARGMARFYPAGAPAREDCGKLLGEDRARIEAQARAEFDYFRPILSYADKEASTALMVQKWLSKWGAGQVRASACGQEEPVRPADEAQARQWLAAWKAHGAPPPDPRPVPPPIKEQARPLDLPSPGHRAMNKPLFVSGAGAAGLGAISLGLAAYYKNAFQDAGRASSDWYDGANEVTGILGLGLLGAGGVLVAVSFP